MKICSLYGAGFYYIPGTDTCLKVGGWVRAEYTWGANGSVTGGQIISNANSWASHHEAWRARGYITADARDQSAYGTIRSYIALGLNTNSVGFDNAANQFNANRAFIQFAGFTFGVAQSFFDFYSVPATAFWGAYPASDTGDPGWFVAAYTAQFGGGFSASVSAEMRRLTQIITAAGGVAGTATTGTVIGASYVTAVPGVSGNAGAYGGFNVPDLVANLRVDQAWGAAQVMGALHWVNSLNAAGGAVPAAGVARPGSVLGWAIGAGAKIFVPMIGAKDYLQAQVNYAQGASRYVFFTPNNNHSFRDGGSGTFGLGVLSDAVQVGPGNGTLALTNAWGVNVAYEHIWNPAWKTSLYGGYAQINYDQAADDVICARQGQAAATCGSDWGTWWIGSRTQWNLTRNLYVGVDVLYHRLQSATGLVGSAALTVGGVSTAGTTSADQDNISVRFRVHRDFYP